MTRDELLRRAAELGVPRHSFALADEPIVSGWNMSEVGSRWSVWFGDHGRTDEEYFTSEDLAYEHLFGLLLRAAAARLDWDQSQQGSRDIRQR